jgi:adenine-specific DNA-methyltransferase
MDEIFCKNENNFVQLISVKTSSPAGFKTVNPGPIDVTEYILFYAKSKKDFKFRKCYVPVEYDENYNQVIINKKERPEKWILKPLRDVIYEQNGIKVGKTPQQSAKNAKEKWGDYWEVNRRQLMAKYALNNAENVVSIRDPHKPTAKLRELLEKSKQYKDKIFIYAKQGNDSDEELESGLVINGGALAFYSNKVKTIEGRLTATELLTDCWLDIRWDGIAKEGGVRLKNGKKPERLIKRIIEMVMGEDQKGLVLDFFCGSGTTCAVAHKLGKQYIGIEQLDYSQDDSKNRLINVVNGDSSGISKVINWKGGGSFIYAELKKWNEQYMKEIKEADTTRKLLNIYDKMKKEAFFRYDVDLD